MELLVLVSWHLLGHVCRWKHDWLEELPLPFGAAGILVSLTFICPFYRE